VKELLNAIKHGLSDLERALSSGSREKATDAIAYIKYHVTYLELLLPLL
jgi:hypothetical protein